MRGRIRSIKPDLFADEKLWDLDAGNPGMHVLRAFEGLWCFADREGRFEWRPRALRSLVLPYWDGDMERVLELLQEGGFIRRYTGPDASSTRDYGVVVNFLKHQTPNNRENASQIPAPPQESTRPQTRLPRVNDASETSLDSPFIQKESSGIGILGAGSWEGERERRVPSANDPPPPNGPKGPNEPRAQAQSVFTQPAMLELFATTFRQLRGELPKLTGKGTDELFERVLQTAKGRNADPRSLFVSRLHRWLKSDLKPIELAAPLACFAAEWGALVDGPGEDPVTALTKRSMAALKAGDSEAYQRLNRELEQAMGAASAAK